MYVLDYGDKVAITKHQSPQQTTIIEPGVYTLSFNKQLGIHLTKEAPFGLPNKIYGDLYKRSDRIFSTFMARQGSTGVILSGEKGSGKTLLAKSLCITAIKEGIPVILVTSGFSGPDFNDFFSSIDQPIVLFWDEFEKIYNKEEQQPLLSFFDGVVSGKRLHLITVNKKHELSDYYNNRPGRFYYNLPYGPLERDFILEYLTENLNDKSQVEVSARILSIMGTINFDMLQAISEEMNRYGEPLSESLKYLNIAPDYSSEIRHTYNVEMDNGFTPEDSVIAFAFHDLMNYRVNLYANKEGDGEEDYTDFELTVRDIIDFTDDVITFEQDGTTIVLTKVPEVAWQEKVFRNKTDMNNSGVSKTPPKRVKGSKKRPRKV
jgi:hypothetical protein